MGDGYLKLNNDAPSEPVHRELEVDLGGGRRQRVPMVGQRMILGRASDAQVKLESPGVSRHHAELFCDPFGRWWIRDLGSRNGTWVNGFTVTERVLEPTDQVQVGECVMRMVLPESASILPPGALAQVAEQQDVHVTESNAGRISTLHDRSGHKIAAQHLSTLMAFGEQLQSVENPADRMKLLCSLMVRREFRGQAAVVLRIRRDKPDEPPRTLCPPQWGPEVKDQSLYISRTLVTALREQARPLVASNVTGQDADVELSNAHAVLAAIACPVRGVEQEIDVLYLLLPPAFGTDEWLALATLAAEHFRQAEQIWASRRQARVNALIEHDLERAREIQMRLVPQEPKVPNLEVAISFQPCRWVGGDYADIVPLSNGRTLLLIADVCGKGLPAALISSSVHTMVRVCVRAGMPLVQVANLLNEHLREYLPANRFVTGVIIELDPATGKIDFINAGHPPPLIVQPGAEPRRMEVTSHPPFGLKDVNYESRGDQLEPGQWLAMYTDGLTEMRDDSGRMLAIERLGDHVRTLVTQTPTATARDLAQRLGDVLDRYQGNRMPADDRTFLLARRT